MKKFFFLIAGIAACLCAVANELQSCYDGKIPTPITVAKETDLYVVVDQTTLLDGGLRQAAANQLRPFLAHGNSFSILVFSAYTQGRYTQLLASEKLAPLLPDTQRNDISKPLLAKLDQCLNLQPKFATQIAGSALRAAFDGSTAEIAKSDIMASMKDIAAKIKKSKASDKVVFLISDMLENSSVSSFYANQGIRKIDPDHELKNAISNQLIGDFAGARVYVMGAGLLNLSSGQKSRAYVDPKTMQALSGFWRAYFEKSNANLIEFGAPALLNQIK
jgi:hypothetical protein